MFVPQFTLITDTGKRYEDTVLPQAVKQIQNREDPSIQNLYGAVDIMGVVPPSNKQGVQDAVFGVAIWEGVDPKADKLQVFVRGLSDGQRQEPTPEDGKPLIRHKALQTRLRPPGRPPRTARTRDHARRARPTTGPIADPGRFAEDRTTLGEPPDRAQTPAYPAGSSRPSFSNAASRSEHESHRPHASPAGDGS